MVREHQIAPHIMEIDIYGMGFKIHKMKRQILKDKTQH